MGIVAEKSGELAKAKTQLMQALGIFLKFNDQHYLGVILGNLARIYKASQDESILTEVAFILGTTVKKVRERFEDGETKKI